MKPLSFKLKSLILFAFVASTTSAFAVQVTFVLPGAPKGVTMCQAIASIDGRKATTIVNPGKGGFGATTRNLDTNNSNVKAYLCAYNNSGALIGQAVITAKYLSSGKIEYSLTGNGVPINWNTVTLPKDGKGGTISVAGVSAIRTPINTTGNCAAWPGGGNALKANCAW